MSYDCKTIQFADNIVIICTHKKISSIIESLQTSLGQIKTWLESLGLELSLSKT